MANKILVPIDGSAEAERVAAQLRDLDAGATIVFANVRTPGAGSARGALIRCLSVYRSRGIDCAMKEVIADSVPEGIVQAATEEGADLIAMYTHDPDDPDHAGGDRVAARVQELSDIEVQVIAAGELAHR